MGGRHSRNKGARGERAVSSMLKRCFPDVRRGRQYDTARECDVEGTPFRIEVKLRKTMPYRLIEEALEQCVKDGEKHKDSRIPLAILKRDSGPFIFAGYLEDLVRIVETLFYNYTKDDQAEVETLFGEEAHEDTGHR